MLSLQDERDIAATLTQYITGVDTKNPKLIEDAFTAQTDADYAPTMKYTTAKQVADIMDVIHVNVGPTLHRLSNMSISPVPGGAQVRTYVDAVIMSKDGKKTLVDACGYYDDTLIKDNGKWRIKKRVLTMVRQTGDMPGQP